jgi:hypothetical protein
VLEDAEAAADCGLRTMQPLGRAGKSAELDDGEEGLDLIDTHRSVFLMRIDRGRGRDDSQCSILSDKGGSEMRAQVEKAAVFRALH